MIIPITLPAPSSPSSPALPPNIARIGTSELVLIELQGDIHADGDRRDQPIGTLTVPDASDTQVRAREFLLYEIAPIMPTLTLLNCRAHKAKPTLRIGHHLLEGKLVSLPKPLAVLHRTTPAPPSDPSAPFTTSTSVSVSYDSPAVYPATRPPPTYTIAAIVRKKLVFARRPMPIVGQSQTRADATAAASAAARPMNVNVVARTA